MGEFDEMLRAGVISPGSQPHVESKRPTPSGAGLPTSTVTVSAEARGSTEAALEETTRRLERARVLVLSADFDLGQRAQSALRSQCHCVVTSDRRRVDDSLSFDLVVLVLAFTDLERVIAHGTPAILVAAPEGRAEAEAIVRGSRQAVVMVTSLEDRLLEQVEALVGTWMPFNPA